MQQRSSSRVRGLVVVASALLALAGGLFAMVQPAQAQTATVLASNTGQPVIPGEFNVGSRSTPVHTRSVLLNSQRAQRFFTGTNNGGYRLTSIGIRFETIADTSTAGADLEVTIRPRVTEGPKTGEPGDAVCTLEDPATFTASGVQTFTVPTTCPNLTENTAYYLHLARNSGTSVINLYRTPTIDPPPAGFAIHNNGIVRTVGFNKWTDAPNQYQIEIRGNSVGGI